MTVNIEQEMDAYLSGVAFALGEKASRGEVTDGSFEEIQNAYFMGIAFRKGEEIAQREMALDEALSSEPIEKWITIFPNGRENEGRRIQINRYTGRILAGLSKEHIGKKISEIGETFKRMKNIAKKKAGKVVEKAVEKVTDKKETTGGEATAKKIKQVALIPHKSEEERKVEIKEKLGGQVQNRDRTTASSKQQMRSIAQNPDYDLLGTSKSFTEGAPVVSLGDIPDENLGKVSVIVDANRNKIQVQYAVVEADKILATNTADGYNNPDYYDENKTEEVRAIAGNGRTAGIQEAYRKGNADEYKQQMIEDADSHKVDPEIIKGMKNPVLVRVMKPEDITSDIGERTNTSSAMAYSNSDRAETDVNRMDKNGWKPTLDKNGQPDLNSIKEFVDGLSKSEQAQYYGADGELNKQAEDRLKMAMFNKAFQDQDLFNKAFEKITDVKTKKMLNALMDSAPSVANLAGLPDGYDARRIISEGVHRFMDTQTGKTVAGQSSIIGTGQDDKASLRLAECLGRRARSAEKLSAFLNDFAEKLQTEAYQNSPERSFANGEDLFGAPQTKNTYTVMKEIYLADRDANGLPLDNELAQDSTIINMSSEKLKIWNRYGPAFIDAVEKGIKHSRAAAHLFMRLNG